MSNNLDKWIQNALKLGSSFYYKFFGKFGKFFGKFGHEQKMYWIQFFLHSLSYFSY